MSTDLIEHCAHDWSLTGGEGPADALGRPYERERSMSALEAARAALKRYEEVSVIGYGAGDHQKLAAALRGLIADADRAEAVGDQILTYLDMNWSTVLDDAERHVLAAGLSEYLEHTKSAEGTGVPLPRGIAEARRGQNRRMLAEAIDVVELGHQSTDS